MELAEGITLAFAKNFASTSNLIELSSGVENVGGAHFPLREWRSPKPDELKLLTKESKSCSPDSVTLTSIPHQEVTNYRSQIDVLLDESKGLTTRYYNKRLLTRVTECLANSLAARNKIELLSHRSTDIQITPPGGFGTAYDFSQNRFVGLHLDNHDRLDTTGRRTSFQVLGLNLGQQERYLHFLNLSVENMIEKLRHFGHNLHYSPSKISCLTRDFFNIFFDYPIIRIKLKPGCAYITTTQYVVHDGAPSNTNESGLDIALLVSGNFHSNEEY